MARTIIFYQNHFIDFYKELNPKYKKEDNPLSMKTEIESIQMTIEEANKIYDKRLSKILKESNAAA